MTKKIDKAWLLFLSSNNYYIYMLLGIYKNLLDVKTKYPIYCGVTPEVNEHTRNILKKVGLNLIELDTSVISSEVLKNVKDKNGDGNYFKAFTKLTLLDTNLENMFNKIVYVDTDVEIFTNIDEIFEYPHMAAIEDVAPALDKISSPYTLGCSKFCSGMFVWDFKNNKGKGHEILTKLPELNKKITWHDQNVLNYFYQDWRLCADLHIPPEYGVMNFKGNISKLEKPIKAIHYTGRLKSGWPFKIVTPLKEKTWKHHKVGFKEWITRMSKAINYFNEKYNLNIPKLYAENLKLMTIQDELDELSKKRADGREGYYLYF